MNELFKINGSIADYLGYTILSIMFLIIIFNIPTIYEIIKSFKSSIREGFASLVTFCFFTMSICSILIVKRSIGAWNQYATNWSVIGVFSFILGYISIAVISENLGEEGKNAIYKV